MLIPSPPITQALTSKTFRPPPLDGSLTLPQIYDWHAKNTTDHRLFVFTDDEGSLRNIYWPEAVSAIWTGAVLIRRQLSQKSSKKIPIVAIVSLSDTITYFTMMMSVIRANFIVFPISPRNSAQAVAHLITKVGVDHILVGRDPSMHDLVSDALEIVKLSSPLTLQAPSVSPIPLFEDLFLRKPFGDVESLPVVRQNPDDIIMYLHSSGSTAHPKPIAWTNHRLAQLALIPWFGEQDLCDKILSLHVMPMYHGMGILQLCWTASSGLVVAAFQPKSPAILPTPQTLFEAAKSTNSDILFCVPFFIEAWSRIPEYIDWLSKRVGVLYGGGPLNKEAGDLMNSKGVSIFVLYGSTEGGIMSPILPASIKYGWEYFRFPDLVTAHMVPYGNDTFELVMVSNKFCRPSVLNTRINGIDAYATSDLLLAHPTMPGYWRVFGRTDDQIIHSTGEKTNPGPLENMLNQDPHVQASVMFGQGRFQAGIIVEPKFPFQFDPNNEDKLSQFRNRLWPTVEKMNEFAPQHSRIFKEMIIVASPLKPFTYTAKNTARRQAILNHYGPEIEATYHAVEETTQSNIPAPSEWNLVSTKNFVRAVVGKVLSQNVQDYDDIFQHGCDSLQATWIRNSLQRALRDAAKIDTRQSTGNFVYEYPSVDALSAYCYSVIAGEVQDSNSEAQKLNLMRHMVMKYSEDLRPPGTKLEKGPEKVVLLTGSTGTLGSHILSELLKSDEINKIYALNRKGIDDLHTRQARALIERGMDDQVEALISERLIFVEGDTSLDGMGLSEQIYNEMVGSVTHVIHNAWRVDFNIGLASFESHVRGLRKLIDFSVASQANFLFVSSIGVLQAIPADVETPHEGPIPPEFALSNGYTQSKWVSEQILEAAARDAGLDYLNIRVGQLTGGFNGMWNAKEWVPTMIQISCVLGYLPSDSKDVSWIPVHHAAAAFLTLLDYRSPQNNRHIHLIHPRPVRWSSLVNVLSTELGIDVVHYQIWLAKLLEETKLAGNHLMPFFQGVPIDSPGNREAFGMANAERTWISTGSFKERIGILGETDVKAWLGYWRKLGII